MSTEDESPIIPSPTPLERGAAAMTMTPDEWAAGVEALKKENEA